MWLRTLHPEIVCWVLQRKAAGGTEGGNAAGLADPTTTTTEPVRVRDSHRKGSGTCEIYSLSCLLSSNMDTEQTIIQIAAQATEQRDIKWGIKTQGTVIWTVSLCRQQTSEEVKYMVLRYPQLLLNVQTELNRSRKMDSSDHCLTIVHRSHGPTSWSRFRSLL